MFTTASARPAATAQLHSHAAAVAMQHPRDFGAPLRHTVVLNWEDVLVPTTLLTQRLGFQPSRQAMENARDLLAQDAYLQQALASIEEQSVALLTAAARVGPVLVVTEKSLKFMEVTCGVFFPRLAAFLLQANMPGAFSQSQAMHNHHQLHRVRVVAAPRKFASAMEHGAWRVSVFQSVCSDEAQRNANYPFSLVNVTSSDRDALACVTAVQKAAGSAAIPKCVLVADDSHPQSLEGFFAQLQTLQTYIGTAAMHPSAFSMRL